MEKLEKCFCGGKPCEPYYYSPSDGYQRGDGFYYIYCKKCGHNEHGETKEDVIKAWNDFDREKAMLKYYPEAEWIFPEDNGNDGNPICSNCHNMIGVVVGSYDESIVSPFCPCCGAIMTNTDKHPDRWFKMRKD